MSKHLRTTSGDEASGKVSPLDRSLEDILSDTLTKLQRLRKEQPRKAEYIERWCENRRKTIDLISKLRKTLDNICFQSNVGRVAGALASLGGIGSVILGAILKYNNIPAGENFLNFGKITPLGPAIFLASNLSEERRTKRPTNEIKKTIEKDIRYTEPIRRWLMFSHEVEYCFNKLLQCDITSDSFPKVIKVLRHCISLLHAGTHEIRDLIRDLRSLKMRGIGSVTIDVSLEVIRFLVRIQRNPKITEPLNEICEIAQETSLRQFVELGVTVYCQTYGILPTSESSNSLYLALNAIGKLYSLVTKISFEEILKRQTAYFDELRRVEQALKFELDQVEASLNEREAGFENLLEELRGLTMGP